MEREVTMKFRKSIAAVCLLACMMLMIAGCAKKNPQTATLEVPSNPTTGYEWTVTQDPELFEISSTYKADEENEGVVGAGGTQTFVLTPKEAGNTTVEFLYERSFEENSTEMRLTYGIKVSKDMQITVESFTGELPGDAETMPEAPELTIE